LLTAGGRDDGGGGGGGGGRICRQYGWLDDSAFDRPSPLCATDRRVSDVYTSRGHVVKLWTMTPPNSVSGDPDVAAATGKRFMIKYAGARDVVLRVVDQCCRSICRSERPNVCMGLTAFSAVVYRSAQQNS